MSLIDLMVLSSDGETPELEMAFDDQEALLRQSKNDPEVADTALDQEEIDAVTEKDGDAAASDLQMTDTDTGDASALIQLDSESAFERKRLYTALKQKADDRRRREMAGMNEERWRAIQRKFGRCSALIKLTDTDIFVGHTTFSDFSEMTRVFKFYDMPLPGSA